MPEGLSVATIASDTVRPPTPTQSSWAKLFPDLSRWRKKPAELPNSFSEAASPGLASFPDEILVSTRQHRPPHSVLPGQPRPITFNRKYSEQRYRLQEHGDGTRQRNSLSATRTRLPRQSNDASRHGLRQRTSAPEVRSAYRVASVGQQDDQGGRSSDSAKQLRSNGVEHHNSGSVQDASAPPDLSTDSCSDSDSFSEGFDNPELQEELDSRWILNLSMAFKDKSDREKFFITYAETPNQLRRLTVSCDYRDKPPDSLEADLKTLPYQRDKSARIYQAVRHSLPEIKFFDTVTNLKLETEDQRLHVHVTEDENEIIKYPKISALEYLNCRRVVERDLHLDSHLSGFVYKVSVHGTPYIKKEIPGPDMIDEFLYEVNALHTLRDCPNVINFQGIVTDDAQTCIKGLLISFAEQGALVDILYDHKADPLSWRRREKWARQIVAGLADIHGYGFVQGDFTLSNIVVDDDDNAWIIDINRRGCPVGWEPPEFEGPIRSGQRISMFIGVKSDLFQLGMVLWSLAVMNDEPDRAGRPLTLDAHLSEVPNYIRQWIETCLSADPTERVDAKVLYEAAISEWSPSSLSADDQNEEILHNPSDVPQDSTDLEAFDPVLAVGDRFGDEAILRGAATSIAAAEHDKSSYNKQQPISQNRDSDVESFDESSNRRQTMSGKAFDDDSFMQDGTTVNGDTSHELSPTLLDSLQSEGHEGTMYKTDASFIAPTHMHPSQQTSTYDDQDFVEEPETLEIEKGLADDTSESPISRTERSQRRTYDFNPPLHQDSGLGGEDVVQNGVNGSVKQTIGPPLHTDSGFDEAFIQNLQSVRLQEQHTSRENEKQPDFDNSAKKT